MKRPLAYITAHWGESTDENMKLAAKYCRAVYDAGYQPICPLVMHSLFLRDAIPQEHKDDLDMSKDYLYLQPLQCSFYSPENIALGYSLPKDVQPWLISFLPILALIA